LRKSRIKRKSRRKRNVRTRHKQKGSSQGEYSQADYDFVNENFEDIYRYITVKGWEQDSDGHDMGREKVVLGEFTKDTKDLRNQSSRSEPLYTFTLDDKIYEMMNKGEVINKIISSAVWKQTLKDDLEGVFGRHE